jgi:hypothetical protein
MMARRELSASCHYPEVGGLNVHTNWLDIAWLAARRRRMVDICRQGLVSLEAGVGVLFLFEAAHFGDCKLMMCRTSNSTAHP